MEKRIEYKEWIIEYDPKPVPPSLGVDWTFYHPGNHNGPEDNWSGCAGSIEEAKERIDDWE